MAATEQVKVKLYWLDNSRSQRILWLLEELKIPYDLEIFHRNKTTMFAPPELERVHPLGKSPVITITPLGGTSEPIVLAESGHMAQYLCDHFPEGQRLVPKRWKDGMEGRIGGETEAWLRNQYFLHYSEGSLMSLLLISLIVSQLKAPPVPFFVRPVTSAISNRIHSSFVFPNIKKHLKLLDQHLETSAGKYLCHDQLSVADILMSFPLMIAKDRFDGMGRWDGGSWRNEFPRVLAYIELLESEEGYQKSVEKIGKLDGQYEHLIS